MANGTDGIKKILTGCQNVLIKEADGNIMVCFVTQILTLFVLTFKSPFNSCFRKIQIFGDTVKINVTVVRVDDGKIIYGEDYCEFLRQNPVAAIVALKTSFASKADLSKFFSDTAKLCSTTFSQYDFEIRESGFEQMLRRKSSQLFLPKLEFESTNSHDRLTPSSKAECQKTFSKEEVYN